MSRSRFTPPTVLFCPFYGVTPERCTLPSHFGRTCKAPSWRGDAK